MCDTGNNTIRVIRNNMVHHVAGGNNGSNSGYVNGGVRDSLFAFPFDVTTDNSGNIFVCDTDNSAIRKITGAGRVLTLAGPDSGDQTQVLGIVGEVIAYPYSVSTDASGNIYIADSDNYKIKKLDTMGKLFTLSGTGDWGADSGAPNVATYGWPNGISTNKTGEIFVTDESAHNTQEDQYISRIVRISPNGYSNDVIRIQQGVSETYYVGSIECLPNGDIALLLSFWWD